MKRRRKERWEEKSGRWKRFNGEKDWFSDLKWANRYVHPSMSPSAPMRGNETHRGGRGGGGEPAKKRK